MVVGLQRIPSETVEVKADGTWRTQTEYDTKYSTSDGKVFRESSGRKTELSSGGHEVSHIQVPREPSLSYLEDGPGAERYSAETA